MIKVWSICRLWYPHTGEFVFTAEVRIDQANVAQDDFISRDHEWKIMNY